MLKLGALVRLECHGNSSKSPAFAAGLAVFICLPTIQGRFRVQVYHSQALGL
jgi:hypothetical protein